MSNDKDVIQAMNIKWVITIDVTIDRLHVKLIIYARMRMKASGWQKEVNNTEILSFVYAICRFYQQINELNIIN